jgi:hypothetical protein
MMPTVAAAGAPAGTPTGEFARFDGCPRFTKGVGLCLYGQTRGGKVTIGDRTVPIERPLVLQGGIASNEQTDADTFYGPLAGDALSPSPQRVTGGLLGMPLYITLELARSASEIEISVSNLVNSKGTALVLPIRARLENPLLGGECYIGSRAQPIALHLTTGTTSPNPPNGPISGEVGRIAAKDEFNLLEVPGDVLVDNTFPVPRATGCGGPKLASLVDPVIDHELGLPSPDGYNTIVEDNTLWEATTVGVIASEHG